MFSYLKFYKLRPYFYALFMSLTCFSMNPAFSWNSLAHKLAAQIAYDHMSDSAKVTCNKYHRALNSTFGAKTFVNAAPWLDRLRYLNKLWLSSLHYINLPFSLDGTRLRPAKESNAISGIKTAIQVLKNPKTQRYDKGFALRVLIHTVADIHQPMHAVSLYSRSFPNGDKGGNLFSLAPNPIAKNLHAYWDRGGGAFKIKGRYSKNLFLQQVANLEKRWPCQPRMMNLDPQVWANESHRLAVERAYTLRIGSFPSQTYQNMVETISEERVALAGCRLAALLNQV